MTLRIPIFMDNHSTTPVDPRVVEAMLPYFTQHFGNAASRNHAFGWTAEAAVENAREQVAALIGGDGKEIVCTSGATESNNLAIKGAAEFHKKQGNHIITVETEHKAVLDTCKRLEREGFEVTYLRRRQGRPGHAGAGARGDDRQDDLSCRSCSRTTRSASSSRSTRSARSSRQNPRRPVPHRRRAGRRQDPVRRRGGEASTCVALSAHKMYGPKGVGAL